MIASFYLSCNVFFPYFDVLWEQLLNEYKNDLGPKPKNLRIIIQIQPIYNAMFTKLCKCVK